MNWLQRFRRWLHRQWIVRTERLCIMLAFVVPRRVVYWAIIRAAEHASGEKMRPNWLKKGYIYGPKFKIYLSYVLEKWEQRR